MYSKGLTKQMLIDMGIDDVRWDVINNTWRIYRNWFKNTSKTIKEYREIPIRAVVCKHKYTKDRSYLKVQWNYMNRTICIPLSRFLYVWFIGDIPDGYVVDHIDNNQFNNQLYNLRILTITENLRKRFVDNPEGFHNQWDAMRG